MIKESFSSNKLSLLQVNLFISKFFKFAFTAKEDLREEEKAEEGPRKRSTAEVLTRTRFTEMLIHMLKE